jgi:archaellum component FlaG (FlaF/FlaG flagellin family)
MKSIRNLFIVGMILCATVSYSQIEYPDQDIDYKSSWQEDNRGDDYVTYSYYLENTGSEPLIFYNFNVTPNTERYEMLRAYPDDILILYPYQKTSYMQVKVFSNGPALKWNAIFLRIADEYSSYPQQNRDYVYYWQSVTKSDGLTTYSYYLKNISDKNIEFYDFSLTNNGGIYYFVDPLLKESATIEPGQNLKMVRYNLKSGDTPSINWFANWSYSVPVGDPFCDGLNKIIEASKEEEFASAKGAIKQKANDSDTFFDQYYCKEHIDGVNDEIIEDILFFWQYIGIVGTTAPLDVINSRYYGYKGKIEYCLPNFPEKAKAEDDTSTLLKVEYEAEMDYLYHYIRLEVVNDYLTGNYKLELVVEQVY